MVSYRGRLDIIADILRVAKQNAKKTEIMYRANLSYKVLEKYLKKTTQACLLEFDGEERCYILTKKGQEFLEAYKDYAKINKRVEQHINNVNDKKKSLEKLCRSG